MSITHETGPFSLLLNDGFTLSNAEMNDKQLTRCIDWKDVILRLREVGN
jgi:hypothetical protein